MKIIDPAEFYAKTKKYLMAVDIGKKGGVVYNVQKRLHSMSSDNSVESVRSAFDKLSPDIIVAENVHTFGGQGMVSNGTLMQEKGIWEGMAYAEDAIKITYIEPKAWIECYTHKKQDNFPTKGQWKNHLAKIAHDSQSFITITSSGIADAWMMWNYYASIIVNDRMRPIGELQFS